MTVLPLYMKTPRGKLDVDAITQKIVNTGFQAAWLKNPDGITQGFRWELSTCGCGCWMSPGCDLCPHMADMALAKEGRIIKPTRFLSENLSDPFRWSGRKNVFVCPQGDLFHDNISDEDILKVFGVIAKCPHHNFVLTTKRDHRLILLNELGKGLSNVYIGVSVESQEFMYRAESLLYLPPRFKKVLFACPMLTEMQVLKNVMKELDWVICSPERGGQGRTARECPEKWQMDLMYQVKKYKIPFFLDVKYDEDRIFRMYDQYNYVPAALLD